MPVAKLTIVKTIPFRGGAEEWSNGWHFNVDSTDPATLGALIDALIPLEQPIHATTVLYKRAYAGPAGANATVFKDSLAVGGLATAGNAHPEACVLLQARIARGRTLMKYLHTGTHMGSTSAGDLAPAGASSSSASLRTKLLDGTLPGGAKWCSPSGAIPPGPVVVDTYLRTHQLPARGKRPTPASG